MDGESFNYSEIIYTYIYEWCICQLQLGWHQVAVVQYTFTHKQYAERHKRNNTYTEQHNNLGVCRRCHVLASCTLAFIDGMAVSESRISDIWDNPWFWSKTPTIQDFQVIYARICHLWLPPKVEFPWIIEWGANFMYVLGLCLWRSW